MTESLSTVKKGQLGHELLHWASRSDLWQLAYRFAELITKINEPLRNSTFVEHIFTLEEEDFEPDIIRELRCSYFPENVVQDDRSYDEYGKLLNFIYIIYCGNKLVQKTVNKLGQTIFILTPKISIKSDF